MLNVVILGAGAMGCLYASYLSKNPNIRITLLDHRREKVETINRDGLVMEENDMSIPFRVPAQVSGRKSMDPVDILLIFVKAHQTYAALKANHFLIGPNTIVVSLQNGMGNYTEIAKFVPLEQIVIGTSNHNSTLLGYGHFYHAADGATIIGAFGKDSPCAEMIRSIFSDCGLDIAVSSDVRKLIWRKLMVNMSINPLTMLLEVRNGFIQSDRPSWEIVRKIVGEGLLVADADGFHFDHEEILELVHKICVLTGTGCSSMFQDRTHRRRTEIDFINGSVVSLARKYGIPVPVNTLIVQMVHAVEDSYSDVGTHSAKKKETR